MRVDNAFIGAFNTTICVFFTNYHNDDLGEKWHLSMPLDVAWLSVDLFWRHREWLEVWEYNREYARRSFDLRS